MTVALGATATTEKWISLLSVVIKAAVPHTLAQLHYSNPVESYSANVSRYWARMSSCWMVRLDFQRKARLILFLKQPLRVAYSSLRTSFPFMFQCSFQKILHLSTSHSDFTSSLAGGSTSIVVPALGLSPAHTASLARTRKNDISWTW